MTKRWENCCWSHPSAGSNGRNRSPSTPSSGQPGLALMSLYCFCACAALLPLSWRGGQGELLDHSSRERAGNAPQKRAAAQSPGAGSSPVYLPSLPGGKRPSDRVDPSSPTLPCQCPSWHRARAGTGSDAVPALCPACSTHHPCTRQTGAATPLPWLLCWPQLPFSGRAVSGGAGS